MDESEKIENLLALSLSSTKEELNKSPLLSAGVTMSEGEEKVWEVIVKYNGNISGLQSERVRVEELIEGYAIITLPESYIERLAALDEIEYIEKPKLLYPGDFRGNLASCIVPVRNNSPYLTGEGVLIAVIDSGIDYYNEVFRLEDGKTRIAYLYDQSLNREFDSEEINQALLAGSRQEALRIVPSRDVTGHGTAVASIAAGKSYESAEQNVQGVATKSRLLIVKMDTKGQGSFPMTTNLMRAFTYVIKKAVEMGMPVAINLSFGNTYGSHNGTSLVERFIDNVSEIGRCVICIGSGNEGASSGHASGQLYENGESETVEFAIGEYETNFNLQLWKSFADQFAITIVHPSGEERRIELTREGTYRYAFEDEEILVYIGFPKPYLVLEEIYFNFISRESYLSSGIWKCILIPVKIVSGEYNIYMPSQTVRNLNTRFFIPSVNRTLTIPSTARRVITVGAYDTTYQSYAAFSGRGYVNEAERVLGLTKPDLVAPGVGILAATEYGTDRFNGTSFATPFVTGAAALLMEWGIVRGNDPYMYGEKVKGYLIRGAVPLPGFEVYPNQEIGAYGNIVSS